MRNMQPNPMKENIISVTNDACILFPFTNINYCSFRILH